MLERLREDFDKRLQVAREEEEVRREALIAKDLRDHLDATNFGRWLQNQILRGLVQGATDRLYRLTSGHYSLDLSDKTSSS